MTNIDKKSNILKFRFNSEFKDEVLDGRSVTYLASRLNRSRVSTSRTLNVNLIITEIEACDILNVCNFDAYDDDVFYKYFKEVV